MSDQKTSERWVNGVMTLHIPTDIDPDSPADTWGEELGDIYDRLAMGDQSVWCNVTGVVHAQIVVDGEPEAEVVERHHLKELLARARDELSGRLNYDPVLMREIENAL